MNARRAAIAAALAGGLALLLGACSTSGGGEGSPSEATSPPTGENELARVDDQGEVSVRIVPLNLTDPVESLEFTVVLDTHSIDLSMDLAALSTLTTDLGVSVEASQWDAPRGGHHVEGILSFPASSGEQELLAGVSRLWLTIRDVDVPDRTFEWPLPAE